jgi:hypothetical protein
MTKAHGHHAEACSPINALSEVKQPSSDPSNRLRTSRRAAFSPDADKPSENRRIIQVRDYLKIETT